MDLGLIFLFKIDAIAHDSTTVQESASWRNDA